MVKASDLKWAPVAFEGTTKRTNWDVRINNKNGKAAQVVLSGWLFDGLDRDNLPCYVLEKASDSIFRLHESPASGLLQLKRINAKANSMYLTGVDKYGPKTSDIARSLKVQAKGAIVFTAQRDGADIILVATKE